MHSFTRHLHNTMTHPKKKWRRPLLLVAIGLLVIVAINLHAAGAILLFKTGSGAFSLNSPIFYILIGLFFVFALFKLKHLLGFLRRHEKSRR